MKYWILILFLFSCSRHLADKRKLCIVKEVVEINQPTITEYNKKYLVNTDCGLNITTRKQFKVGDTLIMITK